MSVIALLFLAVLGGIAGVAALVLGGFTSDVPSGNLAESSFGSGEGETVTTTVKMIFAVIALLMVGFVATMVLGTYRRRAVLDGTTLEVRGLLGTRQADLAASRVWIDSEPEYVRNPNGEGTIPTGRRVPHLVAEDGRNRRKIRLRLHSMARTLLPPHELNALADAIDTGARPGQDAAQATSTSSLLRRLADDPIARLM
ncbi:hypothetical protein [Sphaerisporangium corydalis]|uniref:Alkaline shock response membrane anchor protein AmaP n=1 Tax=Sphaerisporangium corydalis TaxID=1441875 RepID=A0ABV9EJS7_9ACTN|nr:hypothetical protein [Sphaerisporangium corydalis]